ncbi:hypothetical protein [Paenimyroides viscosum]|uniref:Uncharacterized protein n=1 Tax=Paenimyroides viscosum TaxID=2488729 RepID=A0A3P1B2C3_9FLAO|nr:hypothetical protein [Paenimyroides viscosum]RRA95219.1 hypothetical protein EG242_06260 [Paenimyroides viscosum]
MDFDLVDELNRYLLDNKLELAIEVAEKKLSNLSSTEFHKIIGRDLKPLSENLTSYITAFYSQSKNKFEVKAIYSEMNGFTINYDLWFIDLFGYSELGTLDDLDWLSEFEYSSEKSMSISSFEDLQSVYEEYMENEKWRDKELEKACKICELLIILRLQELFKEVKTIAVQRNLDWKDIPLFVTAHDYEMIYEVKK